ncbi:putative 2-phosphosulfolactate phosphatase [Teredinibacter turnerae T7901]|uniref:Probable 2-phosphosulfolactate phosphatase n=1 Tax=Teredinibacter turnerae (strain ATCC 39867 / T7901) TaxID=377629 RepID=C5BLF2_TERTT|nr:2-phosphosulfolactate phosphatase [Teredinibacter turnerae]ACR14421.1 putative 2-phosphosulfolactate phosphatase [Teredinibacter turnerae T7901]
MQIEFVDFVAGAKKAAGIAVVIDVFRAFTTACYCVQQGAARILAVGDSDQALAYRNTLPDTVLLGERFGKCLPGFDFGNSPSEISEVNLQGKTVVHTTHAGTQGLVNAIRADRVFTGALVNAAATVRAIKALEPRQVTLVRMGLNANEASDEDWLCADYLAALLRGETIAHQDIYQQLRGSPYAARFFDDAQPWSPAADFECCLDIDRFDFALQANPMPDGACELTLCSPQGDL